jgi:hypothetical protein
MTVKKRVTAKRTPKLVAHKPDQVVYTPLQIQAGTDDHYKKRAIQPIEYIHANNLPFIEGNVVKYITRWREKGGRKDLEKIKHYVDLLIELENVP